MNANNGSKTNKSVFQQQKVSLGQWRQAAKLKVNGGKKTPTENELRLQNWK